MGGTGLLGGGGERCWEHESSERTALLPPHQIEPVVGGQLKKAQCVRKWMWVVRVEGLTVGSALWQFGQRRLLGRVDSHKWSGTTDCLTWSELCWAQHVVVWQLGPEGRGYKWCWVDVLACPGSYWSGLHVAVWFYRTDFWVRGGSHKPLEWICVQCPVLVFYSTTIVYYAVF